MATKDYTFGDSADFTVSDALEIEVADEVAKLIYAGVPPPDPMFYNPFDDGNFTCNIPAGLVNSSDSGYRETVNQKFGASCWGSNGSSDKIQWLNTASASFFSGATSNLGTVRFWFNPGSTDTSSNERRIFNLDKLASGQNKIKIYMVSNTHTLRAQIFDHTSTMLVEIDYDWSGRSAGVWYHMELGWDIDAGLTKFFINGIEVGTSTATGNRSETTSPSNWIRLGWTLSRSWTNSLWDDMFVYDYVLHTSNFTPPTSPGLPTEYPANKPWVQSIVEFDPVSLDNWEALAELLGAGNEGLVGYNFSVDNGITWEYWNGSYWDITPGDGSDYNTIADATANIDTLDFDPPASPDKIFIRMFLISDGTQQVELDNLELTYSQLVDICYPSAIVYGHFNADLNLDFRSDGKSLVGTPYNTIVQSTAEKVFGVGSISLPAHPSIFPYVDYVGVNLTDWNIFTISVWIKGSGNGRYLEFGHYMPGSSWDNSVVFSALTGNMYINVFDSIGDSHNVAIFDFSSFSGWNHFELNANGNTGVNKFFLNGRLKGDSGGTFTRTVFPLSMGRIFTGPSGEPHYQDELIIYDAFVHMNGFTLSDLEYPYLCLLGMMGGRHPFVYPYIGYAGHTF